MSQNIDLAYVSLGGHAEILINENDWGHQEVMQDELADYLESEFDLATFEPDDTVSVDAGWFQAGDGESAYDEEYIDFEKAAGVMDELGKKGKLSLDDAVTALEKEFGVSLEEVVEVTHLDFKLGELAQKCDRDWFDSPEEEAGDEDGYAPRHHYRRW